DLYGVFQSFAGREALGTDKPAERLTGNELHRDEVDPAGVIDVVNVQDVGVVQGGGGAGLLHEAAFAFGTGDGLSGKNFDSHWPVEVGIVSLIDHAHPAFAQLRFEAVMAECPTDHRLHGNTRS